MYLATPILGFLVFSKFRNFKDVLNVTHDNIEYVTLKLSGTYPVPLPHPHTQTGVVYAKEKRKVYYNTEYSASY